MRSMYMICADKQKGSDKMVVMSHSDGKFDDQHSEDLFCGGNSAGMSPELNRQDSLASEGSFRRSNSDASVYSEQTDDGSSLYSGSPSPMHWLLGNRMKSPHILSRLRTQMHKIEMDDQELEEELMKQRFAKLIVDGVAPKNGAGDLKGSALAVSQTIESTFASILTNYKRLEPLDLDSKATWRREVNLFLSLCDHIYEVEYQIEVDKITGKEKKVQVPIAPRADMISSLPALKILDSLLMEMMDSFEGMGLDQIKYEETEKSASGDGSPDSNPEEWWVPTPLVPEGGFSKKLTRFLEKQHKSATQIHKAAKHFNGIALADMDIPESYMETLPKTARAKLGDVAYHHMLTVDKFEPDELVNYFNPTSSLDAHGVVDMLESAIVIWRRKASELQAKPSWKAVKELVTDADKNTVLANRAEATITHIKRRYPQFPQSSLEASKIGSNKDMGKAILESYSRVLEGFAFKIISLIEKFLAADGQPVPSKNNEKPILVVMDD